MSTKRMSCFRLLWEGGIVRESLIRNTEKFHLGEHFRNFHDWNRRNLSPLHLNPIAIFVFAFNICSCIHVEPI